MIGGDQLWLHQCVGREDKFFFNDGLDVRYVDLLSKVGLEQELVDIDIEPHD